MSAADSVTGFFQLANEGKKLPVAVPGKVMACSISTEHGSFMARSSSPRARALAAVMALSDAHAAVAARS